MKNTLILASASPRRKDLLKQIGIEPVIMPDDSPEISTSKVPAEMVRELSAHKAGNIAAKVREDLVLGADTVVAIGGEILGKPKDEASAFEMLKKLSGKIHAVYTGVTLILVKDGKEVKRESFTEETLVSITSLSDEEINDYIATGEPFDKAGGYGIQTAFAKHIDRIEGDYFNVVGLPLAAVYSHIIDMEK